MCAPFLSIATMAIFYATINNDVNAYLLPHSSWDGGRKIATTFSTPNASLWPIATDRMQLFGNYGMAYICPRKRKVMQWLSNSKNYCDEGHQMDADETNGKKESSQSKLQEELSNIQIQLTLIEAIEARNEAQIYSFVDEQDQWESMDEEDRLLLQSKLLLEERRDDIESELELR